MVDVLYIVSSTKYWREIPSDKQTGCGKVRFTDHRIVPSGAHAAFQLKAEAVKFMKVGDLLVREVQLEPERWHYQLLLIKGR